MALIDRGTPMSARVRRRFAQVDVFTTRPFLGNPLAVVLDAEGLADADMQRIAHWTHLSETTFVLPPTVAGADYRVRIFGRTEEFPFAGHPTLGTAQAVLDAGIATPRDGRLVMECAAGLVDVAVEAAGLSFRLPPYATRATRLAERTPAALGIREVIGEVSMIETGPHWLVARVPDVDALAPDASLLRDLIAQNRASGITAYTESGPEAIEVRTFFFIDTMVEDPVCGSGNAAVAVHRLAAGAIGDGTTYCARQGRHVGRDGEVRVRIVGTDVHVGGSCVACVRGELLA
jgi:PhzF family phenazine biosynthesis protein